MSARRRKPLRLRGQWPLKLTVVVTGKCLTPSCKNDAVFFCDRCLAAIAAFKKIEERK